MRYELHPLAGDAAATTHVPDPPWNWGLMLALLLCVLFWIGVVLGVLALL